MARDFVVCELVGRVGWFVIFGLRYDTLSMTLQGPTPKRRPADIEWRVSLWFDPYTNRIYLKRFRINISVLRGGVQAPTPMPPGAVK